MSFFLMDVCVVVTNFSIPQEEHYRNVQFNLEAEPRAEDYSDSDDIVQEGK